MTDWSRENERGRCGEWRSEGAPLRCRLRVSHDGGHEYVRRPIVIRKISRRDRYGAPKVAVDRKAQVTLEKIVAQTTHPCAAGPRCTLAHLGGLIRPGVEYAKVTSQRRRRWIGGKSIPESSVYHFSCVPPEAARLVRFFV